MELYGTIMELFMVGKFGQPGELHNYRLVKALKELLRNIMTSDFTSLSFFLNMQSQEKLMIRRKTGSTKKSHKKYRNNCIA